MLNKFDRTQFERLEILFSKPTKCTTSWKIYRFGMESSESWERLISLNKIVQRSYIWPIEFVTIRKHRTRSNRTSWPIDRLRRVDTRWNERKIMRNRGIRSEKVEKSVWLIWGKKGNRNRYELVSVAVLLENWRSMERGGRERLGRGGDKLSHFGIYLFEREERAGRIEVDFGKEKFSNGTKNRNSDAIASCSYLICISRLLARPETMVT